MKNWWVLRLRFISFLIDFVLPTLIVNTLFTLIVKYIFSAPFQGDLVGLIGGYSMIISLLLKDLSGNSLGKRITGFKIISLLDNAPPRTSQLFLRNLLVFLTPFEAVMVIFRPDHRRIGDLLAHTMVVRKNQ